MAKTPSIRALTVHTGVLCQRGDKTELFALAHTLTKEMPEEPLAWYAVGCYYYLLHKYEAARKYFSKCTAMDPKYVLGWMGLAHSFSAEDEYDQAMNAYRAVIRMFDG